MARCDGRLAWISRLALATSGALVVGCGGSWERVARLQGAVTLNGKPLPHDAKAFLVFATEENGAASVSVPVTNGRYDSPRTPLGSLHVYFEISREVGSTRTSERTGQAYRDIENLVPAKYATGVPLEVNRDNPNQDFDLAK